MTGHPADEFHPPTSDDPYWTETAWFTFAVPERREDHDNWSAAGARRFFADPAHRDDAQETA